MDKEPNIIINGRKLTNGQAMTIRVALNSFSLELQDQECVKAIGEIGPLYRDSIRVINKIIFGE